MKAKISKTGIAVLVFIVAVVLFVFTQYLDTPKIPEINKPKNVCEVIIEEDIDYSYVEYEIIQSAFWSEVTNGRVYIYANESSDSTHSLCKETIEIYDKDKTDGTELKNYIDYQEYDGEYQYQFIINDFEIKVESKVVEDEKYTYITLFASSYKDELIYGVTIEVNIIAGEEIPLVNELESILNDAFIDIFNNIVLE